MRVAKREARPAAGGRLRAVLVEVPHPSTSSACAWIRGRQKGAVLGWGLRRGARDSHPWARPLTVAIACGGSTGHPENGGMDRALSRK